MRKFNVLLVGLLFLTLVSTAYSQARKELTVPKADSGAVSIDGQMNEAAWQNAAQVNLITSSGYEIFANKYYREGLAEPEYDELYARLLWSKDTLYAFIHIDEFVNDSTNLFWVPTQGGHWGGDQLFVSISNRLGRDMKGWYDGNVYAAPDGPYHLLILGEHVTLNGNDTSFIPEEYRGCPEDSMRLFHASEVTRYAVSIDTLTGRWDIELAIYNPNVNADGEIGFNIGGSTGSRKANEALGDAYGYYTWQPNLPNDPYGDPYGNGDPGFYNLANDDYWAVLHFTPGNDDIMRAKLDVPYVNSDAISIDGNMNDPAWQTAAEVNLITSGGYNIFANKYYREGLSEPEYDELYGRLLWSEDTLYVFVHIDEFVNDSTNLFWVPTQSGHWGGDQLFISLSNRLGREMKGWYDGNVYAAPDGPYHLLILGEHVTLNGNDTSFVPDEYRSCFDDSDSLRFFQASDVARYAVSIDTLTGKWDIELAIYNPHVAAQSSIAFNMGGSTGSRKANEELGDAYGYYTWQPNIPNDPYGDPFGNGDPGFYNLANSEHWAMISFTGGTTGIDVSTISNNIPENFNLHQNYPNPFNPTTNIRFDITRPSAVTLKVYNVVGEVVATLVQNESFNAGTFSVNWDASSLASGVYIYRLEAEGLVSSMKMMLLK